MSAAPIVLILAALLYWKLHSGSPKVISVGYVGDRDVILWNTLAQVRESVGEVHYGDRVEVVRVEGPAMQVRTPSGTIGWMRDSRQIGKCERITIGACAHTSRSGAGTDEDTQ